MLQGRWAFRLDVDKEYYYGDVFSGWVDLVYDKCLFEMTWTVSKFNGIISIFSEEFPKFVGNRQCVNLIGM